jgi:G patch domain-containing protein 1
LIDDIIVPSSEPVGIRLLKRMGWKPGQGIGPRVSRRQRKPGDGLESDEDDEHLANVTFAPIDSAVVVFTNKTNHQGLGFDPYKHAPEFDRSLQSRAESSYLASESKAKKTGFGFGTFDDNDDEDDVYGSGPKPLRSMDYDMDLNDRPRSKRDDRREKEKSTMVCDYYDDQLLMLRLSTYPNTSSTC